MIATAERLGGYHHLTDACEVPRHGDRSAAAGLTRLFPATYAATSLGGARSRSRR
jgi:hypothetical protein